MAAPPPQWAGNYQKATYLAWLNATKYNSQEDNLRTIGNRTNVKEDISHLCNYFKARDEARSSLIGLEDALLTVLPAETLERVFQFLAASRTASFSSQQQAEHEAFTMVRHLPSLARLCLASDTYDSEHEKVETLLKSAVLAMVQEGSLFLSTKGLPNATTTLIRAPEMADDYRFLHHVELGVYIPATTARHYPADLYKIQNTVSRLKGWYPNLQSILIEIDVPSQITHPSLVGRGFDVRKTTTLLHELGVLITKILEVDIQEKTIWYHVAGRKWGGRPSEEVTEMDIYGSNAEEMAAYVLINPGNLIRLPAPKERLVDAGAAVGLASRMMKVEEVEDDANEAE